MAEDLYPSEPENQNDQDHHHEEVPSSRIELRSGKYSSRFINIERRIAGDTAFPSEDDIFYASPPRPSHWSIAWSDLMMTMFVLFLCMFVYKAANEEFLGSQTPEIVGGDTTDALETMNKGDANLPFSPIYPGVPLMTAGTIKKVEQEQAPLSQAAPPGQPEASQEEVNVETAEAERQIETEYEIPAPMEAAAPATIAVITQAPEETEQPIIASAVPPEEDEIQPRPLVPEEPLVTAEQKSADDIFRLSQDTLEDSGLEKFAAIDLVPDQTMRIILTSDLLFGLGRSELSTRAQSSLMKIGAVIKNTPYMINVVGHTDNVPMVSSRFASNWELSVARASTVARFLIDNLKMNPNQFVVSGYSSYRPMLPNSTAENRAKNRRVEIIISKKLPQPQPATAENLR